MSATIAKKLDLKLLSCPLPIVETAKAMRELAPGELIEVEATDPGSVPDFTAWCKTTGHELIETTKENGVYRFLLRKRA